jgi:hypothetical protein
MLVQTIQAIQAVQAVQAQVLIVTVETLKWIKENTDMNRARSVVVTNAKAFEMFFLFFSPCVPHAPPISYSRIVFREQYKS